MHSQTNLLLGPAGLAAGLARKEPRAHRGGFAPETWVPRSGSPWTGLGVWSYLNTLRRRKLRPALLLFLLRRPGIGAEIGGAVGSGAAGEPVEIGKQRLADAPVAPVL